MLLDFEKIISATEVRDRLFEENNTSGLRNKVFTAIKLLEADEFDTDN